MMNVLFVCTGNWDRSPTAEMIFKDHPGWEVKSAGISFSATRPIKPDLISWADKIIVMEWRHRNYIINLYPKAHEKIIVLGIDDCYDRYSAKLIGLIIYRMAMIFKFDSWILKKFNL